MGDLIKVRIAKAAKSIEVDPDTIEDNAIYAEIFAAGLEVMLNKRMSKIPGATKGNDDDKAAAVKVAEENLAMLQAGQSLVRKRAETKLPAAVRAEAMRLAKMILKDEARAAGLIPSRIESKVFTEGAKRYLESEAGPALIAQAEENLSHKPKVGIKVDLSALGITESPKLVAKAEKAKAERKTQLSASQAGKVAPRKGQAQEHRAH